MNKRRIRANIPAAALGAFCRDWQYADDRHKPVAAIPAYKKILFPGLWGPYIGSQFHGHAPLVIIVFFFKL
jgi:hypothetical protein